MAAKYDQFVLFGDSLTEGGCDQGRGFGFLAQLSHDYRRKLDVVNRGFGGYNTDQAIQILPDIIPDPQHTKVRLLTVFFGANDASDERAVNKQHVSLENYEKNLRAIITHPSVTAHAPKIILITPPPINEYTMKDADVAMNGFLARTANRTKTYADAVLKVGKQLQTEHPELEIEVLDLWGAVLSNSRNGWVRDDEPIPGSMNLPEDANLKQFFHDGLHFAPVGYRILYTEIKKRIQSKWPELEPEALPFVHPYWMDWQPGALSTPR